MKRDSRSLLTNELDCAEIRLRLVEKCYRPDLEVAATLERVKALELYILEGQADKPGGPLTD